MDSIKARHIWIIGCSTGIGRALAIALCAHGAHLILSARNTNFLAELNADLGDQHQVLPLDVTDISAVHAAVTKIPILDSVIYMAGTYEPMAMDQLDIDTCKKIVDTNFMGALHVIHAVLPLISASRPLRQIVLCASVAGYRGLPNAQPYGATKAALINLAESLRAEMGPRGLDVRVINPGFVKTPMTDKNKFHMPMMITPKKAADAIIRGLTSSRFDIHFPLRFTILIKILRILPNRIYFTLVKK